MRNEDTAPATRRRAADRTTESLNPEARSMLTHLGIPSTCPHVTPYALLPNIWTPSATPSLPQQQRRRRLVRTLPNTARRLHPVNRAPEGVPSSLFNFRRKVPRSPNEDGNGGEGAGDSAAATAAEALESGVVEDSDLDGVSALLVEVRVLRSASWSLLSV